MKTWMRIVVVAFVILVLLLHGCSHPRQWVPYGTRLKFDSNTDRQAARSISSSWTSVNSGLIIWANSQNGAIVSDPTHDFNEYFALTAIYGRRGMADSGIVVTDIWQKQNVVYVRAQFLRDTIGMVAAMENTPSDTVWVSKRNMLQFGELTFIIMDDYLKERARITAIIDPPATSN